MTVEASTVYVLGASLNRVIRDFDGESPPLAFDLFRVAAKLDETRFLFGDEEKWKRHRVQLNELFDFIRLYWRLDRNALKTEPFDLEECFTLLEAQFRDATEPTQRKRLGQVEFQLSSLLMTILGHFDSVAGMSPTLRALGRTLYREKPTIVSFNYDTYIEQAIESAGGDQRPPPAYLSYQYDGAEVPDEMLAYSYHSWKRSLAYGRPFDEVQLAQAGPPIYVPGDRFYAHPGLELYSSPILKLHGSLNWFRYTRTRQFPEFVSPSEHKDDVPNLEHLILMNGRWGWRELSEPLAHNGWYILPVVVPPVLFKQELYESLGLDRLRAQAAAALSECKRLVVIGYSMPPTDFANKQLFTESLAGRELDELVIVNPDGDVVRRTQQLCPARRQIVCGNLETFVRLNSFDAVFDDELQNLIAWHDTLARDRASTEGPSGR